MIAIIKEPKSGPRIENIAGGLANYLELVGGYIRETYIGEGIKCVSNDNEQEVVNFIIDNDVDGENIYGVAVFVGNENGEDCDLSKEQIELIINNYFMEV